MSKTEIAMPQEKPWPALASAAFGELYSEPTDVSQRLVDAFTADVTPAIQKGESITRVFVTTGNTKYSEAMGDKPRIIGTFGARFSQHPATGKVAMFAEALADAVGESAPVTVKRSGNKTVMKGIPMDKYAILFAYATAKNIRAAAHKCVAAWGLDKQFRLLKSDGFIVAQSSCTSSNIADFLSALMAFQMAEELLFQVHLNKSVIDEAVRRFRARECGSGDDLRILQYAVSLVSKSVPIDAKDNALAVHIKAVPEKVLEFRYSTTPRTIARCRETRKKTSDEDIAELAQAGRVDILVPATAAALDALKESDLETPGHLVELMEKDEDVVSLVVLAMLAANTRTSKTDRYCKFFYGPGFDISLTLNMDSRKNFEVLLMEPNVNSVIDGDKLAVVLAPPPPEPASSLFEQPKSLAEFLGNFSGSTGLSYDPHFVRYVKSSKKGVKNRAPPNTAEQRVGLFLAKITYTVKNAASGRNGANPHLAIYANMFPNAGKIYGLLPPLENDSMENNDDATAAANDYERLFQAGGAAAQQKSNDPEGDDDDEGDGHDNDLPPAKRVRTNDDDLQGDTEPDEDEDDDDEEVMKSA